MSRPSAAYTLAVWVGLYPSSRAIEGQDVPAQARFQDPYASPIPTAAHTQNASQTFLSVPDRCQRATLSRKLILRRGRARLGKPGRFIRVGPPCQEIT